MLRRRPRTDPFERQAAIATSDALTAEIRATLEVGSPGNSGTAPPPHRPITASDQAEPPGPHPLVALERLEVIVVEPALEVGELGSLPEAAGAIVAVAVSPGLEVPVGRIAVISSLGFTSAGKHRG